MYDEVATPRERLEELLRRKGITQAALARKTGIAKSTISYWLSGQRKIGRESIALISQALDVNPSWLMGYDALMDDFDHSYRLGPERTKFSKILANQEDRSAVIDFVKYANEKEIKKISKLILERMYEESKDGDMV